MMSKRILAAAMLCSVSCLALAQTTSTSTADGKSKSDAPPNIVLIFADDLGYGDLSCYGNTAFKTPRLDEMAKEGVKLTQFYVASPACSPSRASLLTGQYPMRAGVPNVLMPKSMTGLVDQAPVISEVLKKKGYTTAVIGKWHLGALPKFMPWNRGFDYFYGLPYSNDMSPTPVFRNKKIIEKKADQNTLTRRYTEETIKFIDKATAKDQPFFVYLPHTFTHVPLHVSDKFKGSSGAGLYGDVTTELDWSVGEILDHLKEKKLADNTLVIFTSDNGPWTIKGKNGGSAGKLRGAKGQDYEGGVREPFIAWWPGHLPAGKVVDIPAMTVDMMPTLAHLAGAKLPQGPKYDGKDIWPVISKGESVGERTFAYPDYYFHQQVGAIRVGDWKLLLSRKKYKKYDARTTELINMKTDPYEKHNVADQHPDVVKKLAKKAYALRKELKKADPWHGKARQNSPEALRYVTAE